MIMIRDEIRDDDNDDNGDNYDDKIEMIMMRKGIEIKSE